MKGIVIRALELPDWQTFKDFRLYFLKVVLAIFASTRAYTLPLPWQRVFNRLWTLEELVEQSSI